MAGEEPAVGAHRVPGHICRCDTPVPHPESQAPPTLTDAPSPRVKGFPLRSQLVFITREYRVVPGERRQVASLSDPAEGMGLGPYHSAEGREEEKVLGKCGRFGGWSAGGEAWEALAQNQPRPPHLEAQPRGVGSLWSSQSPHPLPLCQEGPCPAPGGHAVVDSDVLSVTGYGPGFLAQPLSIEQGTQAGCPPSAHSGHGSGWLVRHHRI